MTDSIWKQMHLLFLVWSMYLYPSLLIFYKPLDLQFSLLKVNIKLNIKIIYFFFISSSLQGNTSHIVLANVEVYWNKKTNKLKLKCNN